MPRHHGHREETFMRQVLGSLAVCAALVPWSSASIKADTNAPNRQTFTLQCGGSTITVVSPVEAARAAQIVDATGVGVLQQVMFEGVVLFEQPSLQAHKGSALTTCTQDALTVVVLMTPQAKPGK
jgi:hypothetical protein